MEVLPRTVLVDAALGGLTDALDAHSRWLSAEEVAALEEEASGQRPGLGLDLRFTEDGAGIVAIVPGGPADRAGIRIGDRLLKVDGQVPVAEALQDGTRPRGDDAKPAKLVLQRSGSGETVELEVMRERVVVPPVEFAWLAPGLAYARVRACSAGSADALAAALVEVPADARLVLDLRDNPGGLLTEAVALADTFLDHGLIVEVVERAGSTPHAATPGAWAGPLVVVVNGRTASSAEIVTAALQDTGRAKAVGTATFGKGTVQSLYAHPEGSALRLTTARYLTPLGHPVAPRSGRVPDVLVAWPTEGSTTDRLRAGVQALDVAPTTRDELLALVDALPRAELRDVRSPIPWHLPPIERLAADPQLQAAVDLAL